ncbi:MAG: TVP38/TMEM64 family protein [Gemmatimonas sp.]|nr:TVP38/TMEM64 family protein [Gemmatimonas sp.]
MGKPAVSPARGSDSPTEAVAAKRERAQRSAISSAARWIGALLLVALLVWIGRTVGGRLPAFVDWVESQGTWAPILFVLGYAAATVAFVPGSLLTLAAGAVFGVARGVTLVFLGAVLGSSLAFLLARHAARPLVESRIANDSRFDRIDRAVARRGRKIVFLLRLSPLLPYNLLNYALGLTRVRFPDYLLASIGMLPGTLLYVYSGRVIGDLAALAGGASIDRGAAYYAVLALGLVATAAVTFWITRIAREAIRTETAAEGNG